MDIFKKTATFVDFQWTEETGIELGIRNLNRCSQEAVLRENDDA
jgi:hypothetical protein